MGGNWNSGVDLWWRNLGCVSRVAMEGVGNVCVGGGGGESDGRLESSKVQAYMYVPPASDSGLGLLH